jgi:nucleotide-binding universal stress UspA family protein
MKTENAANSDVMKDRHILIALDESENAKRALLYAADFLGGSPGFRATILNIIPVPSEDYFDSDSDQEKWVDERKTEAEGMLERYREILVQSGFGEDKVATSVEIRHDRSVAECILDAQKRLDCCTVIVGRRGISKKEEFIYGSTSSKVLHSGKNCAVWVIE